jgi:integrase
MATLQKRNGSWRALVRVSGHPARSKTFNSKTKAKLWAAKMEDAIKAGELPGAEAERPFAEVMREYREVALPQLQLKTEVERDRQLQWWTERFGQYAIGKVDAPMVGREKDAMLGRGLSPSRVNRMLAALSGFFKWAAGERKIVKANPVRDVSKPREPKGRVRFLSDDERKRLLAVCKASDDPRLHPLVVLAVSTGARQGELMGLRWRDVDLERGVAYLRETKNTDTRALPLHGLAVTVLRDLGKVRRLDTDLAFADASGKATFPRAAWNAALKAAKVKDFRFHDTRHTAASYLAMNGATLTELAAILGHRTLAMVQRYAHLTEQHQSAVVQRMNETVFGGGD